MIAHQSRLLSLGVLQQIVQPHDVHSMFHHKLSIQVEDRYVPLVPVQPNTVLWKTDVHLFQDKLQRDRQTERPVRETDRQTDRKRQTRETSQRAGDRQEREKQVRQRDQSKRQTRETSQKHTHTPGQPPVHKPSPDRLTHQTNNFLTYDVRQEVRVR